MAVNRNQYPMQMVRGTRLDITLTFYDSAGDGINLSSAEPKAVVRDVAGNVQGIFEITLDNQTTNPGRLTLSMEPVAPTATLSAGEYLITMPRSAVWDIAFTGLEKAAFYQSTFTVIESPSSIPAVLEAYV